VSSQDEPRALPRLFRAARLRRRRGHHRRWRGLVHLDQHRVDQRRDDDDVGHGHDHGVGIGIGERQLVERRTDAGDGHLGEADEPLERDRGRSAGQRVRRRAWQQEGVVQRSTPAGVQFYDNVDGALAWTFPGDPGSALLPAARDGNTVFVLGIHGSAGGVARIQ